MLTTLLIWAYLFVLSWSYGSAAMKLLKLVFHLDPEDSSSLPITTVLGMMVLTTVASYLSVLMPLSELAAIIILGGGIAAAIWARDTFKFNLEISHFAAWALVILAGLALLEYSTNAPVGPDTALYQAQTIRWIETFHAVPGLANIHYRLAENSSWMILNALFSFAFLGIQSFHLAGSFLLLVTLLYFAQGLQNLLERKISISSIAKSLLFFLPLYFFGSGASSPGTDMPAALLIWITIALLLEKLENSRLKFDIRSVIIFLLSLFAVTVKLSAFPLTAIALVIMLGLFARRNFTDGLSLAGIGLLVLLPWLIRSVILSGYLVFPVSQLDFFNFDWKYPQENITADRTAIIWFARFPNKNWADYIGTPITAWAPLWFAGLSLKQKLLFLMAAGSPIGLLLLRVKKSLKELNYYVLPYLVNFLGIVFWFLTAPNIRFGLGFILMSVVLLISPITYILLTANARGTTFVVLLFFAAAVVFQGYSLYEASDFSTLRHQIILPADYLPSRAKPCPIHNGTLFCRKVFNQCNYEAFPCIAKPQKNVEMRGATLQDGFRQIPTP